MFTLLFAIATAAAPDAPAELPAATMSFDAGTARVTVRLDKLELRFFDGFGPKPKFHTTAGTHLVSVSRDTMSWTGWVYLKPGANEFSLWQPIEVTGLVVAPDGGTASGVTVQIESEHLTWGRHGIWAPRYQRFGRIAASDAGHFTTTVAEPGTYRLHA